MKTTRSGNGIEEIKKSGNEENGNPDQASRKKSQYNQGIERPRRQRNTAEWNNGSSLEVALMSKYTMAGYGEFTKQFEKESDRSVVILAVSYLEQYLVILLKKKLVQHKSTNEMFEGYGPISSLAAKIDIAFSLGLFSEKLRTDLHYLRKIRNVCAHEDEIIDFNHDRIRDLCANLDMAEGIPHLDGKVTVLGTMAQFLWSIFWCILHIDAQLERTSNIPELKLRFEMKFTPVEP